MLLTALLLNLFLFLAILFYHHCAKLTLLSVDLWIAILYLALLPTIFGINLIFLTDMEISFGAHSLLTDETLKTVYIEYYISWIFLLILMGMGQGLLKLQDRNAGCEQLNKTKYASKFYFLITFSAIGLLCVDLLMMESWPGVEAVTGEIFGAEASKGAFINEKMQNSIPVVGYLTRFLPNLVAVLLFERYLHQQKSFLFYLLIAFFLVYATLTLIKSFLLSAIIACFIVYLLNTRKKIRLRFVLKATVAVILSIFIPFSLLMGGDTMEVFGNIVKRVFIVQIEGAFLIRQIYTETRLDALLEGFPLLARFGVETLDPARGVIIEVFGEQPGWVNMNSHFVGQGFVMFGPLISIIGPIILFLNFVMLSLLSRTLSLGSSQYLSSTIVISCALFVPINNNFGNAVYFKSIIAYVIVYAFLRFLMSLSRIRILPANQPLSGISK